MFNNPQTIGLALLFGLVPSLLWLWFWLKEDQKKHEPRGLLALCFIAGMVSVVLVLPIQKFLQHIIASQGGQVVAWAGTEEIIKFLAAALVLWKTQKIDEPIEWPIYMITVALGFAALENTLFLIQPLALHETTVGLITGQLRFLGSTLLHSISSGLVGISLGLSLGMRGKDKLRYLFGALAMAIALHSLFNFLIIENDGSGFLKVFGFLWVVTVVIMLLFEKVRRLAKVKTTPAITPN